MNIIKLNDLWTYDGQEQIILEIFKINKNILKGITLKTVYDKCFYFNWSLDNKTYSEYFRKGKQNIFRV